MLDAGVWSGPSGSRHLGKVPATNPLTGSDAFSAPSGFIRTRSETPEGFSSTQRGSGKWLDVEPSVVDALGRLCKDAPPASVTLAGGGPEHTEER